MTYCAWLCSVRSPWCDRFIVVAHIYFAFVCACCYALCALCCCVSFQPMVVLLLNYLSIYLSMKKSRFMKMDPCSTNCRCGCSKGSSQSCMYTGSVVDHRLYLGQCTVAHHSDMVHSESRAPLHTTSTVHSAHSTQS